jgi:nicotinamidase-related amidase
MQRAYGLEIPETLEEVCDTRRSALLVYDMQVGIVPHVREPQDLLGRVVQVIDVARAAGVRVVLTRHMSVPNEQAGVFQLRTAMAWQRVGRVEDVKPLFLHDSPAFAFVPEITPEPGDLVLDKLAMSAFVGTSLELLLRDRGIVSLVVVGAVLEIGIEPTVRHGCDLGFIPVVVTDACGVVEEDAGRRTLESLEYAAMSLQTDTATLARLWRE